jgi:hypothetical protein
VLQHLGLAPVRVLTSRPAIKVYLSGLLFLSTSAILLTISSTAYGFFYYNYVPQINLERVIYLQYGGGGGAHPHATTALDTTALISQQAYDVDLILDMPRTPTNLQAGNFMLDLALLGSPAATTPLAQSVSALLANITTPQMSVLYHSRRPAILPYSSPIVSLSRTFLHLPWHLLGVEDLDSTRLVVPMFEMLAFPRGGKNIPTHARVELQSTTGGSSTTSGGGALQVYAARLSFQAKFQGMRYLIYKYRLTAFVLFTALFYSVSVTSMVLAWAVISTALSYSAAAGKEEGKMVKHDDTDEKVKPEPNASKVKTEEEDTEGGRGFSLSNLSDTATQFPTARNQMPLRFPGRLSSQNGEEDLGLTRPIGPEAADDEGEDDGPKGEEGAPRRFDADSGIGTSMESEHAPSGIVRRRSSRGGGFSNHR